MSGILSYRSFTLCRIFKKLDFCDKMYKVVLYNLSLHIDMDIVLEIFNKLQTSFTKISLLPNHNIFLGRVINIHFLRQNNKYICIVYLL